MKRPSDVRLFQIACSAPPGMREIERAVSNKLSFGRRNLQVFLFAAIDEHGWRSIEQMIRGGTGFPGWLVTAPEEAMFGENRVVWRVQSLMRDDGRFSQVLNGVIHCTKVPCALQMNADREPIDIFGFAEWLGTPHR